MYRREFFPFQSKRGISILGCVLFMTYVGGKGAPTIIPKLHANEPPKTQSQEEKKFMNTITGEFEVKIVPVDSEDSQIGMMLLDKKYLGDLDATGKGRMLTGMTSVKNSAAYVAIERIEGVLKGKRGNFLIQHSGSMSKGSQTLVIRVVPDSGTGDLLGLEGTMDIRIVDRKHFYDFQYTLPEAAPVAATDK